jgi:3-oxoacyl-ACP reductase-like protein
MVGDRHCVQQRASSMRRLASDGQKSIRTAWSQDLTAWRRLSPSSSPTKSQSTTAISELVNERRWGLGPWYLPRAVRSLRLGTSMRKTVRLGSSGTAPEIPARFHSRKYRRQILDYRRWQRVASFVIG